MCGVSGCFVRDKVEDLRYGMSVRVYARPWMQRGRRLERVRSRLRQGGACSGGGGRGVV